MEEPSRVFISPHPDDIAFCCFASLVNPPADLKSTLIITVFTKSLTALSGFGERGSVEEITKIRRKEDLLFASTVGCNLQFLEFPDSSVRFTKAYSECISQRDTIFLNVKKTLSDIIIPLLGKVPIYVPLGIGGHPDHCIVRDAVKDIIYESPVQHDANLLLFYEDLPYATRFADSAIKEFALKTIAPTAKSISIDLKGVWKRKKAAVKIYESQLKPRVLPALTKHARQVGSEYREAERLWFDEPDTILPLVETLVWISWESARPQCEITTIFEDSRRSRALQTAIGREILLGPLYMPINSTKRNIFAHVESIAGKLDCKTVYPIITEISHCSLNDRVCDALRDIERRYDVDVFYLRDRKDYEHPVDRILINLSTRIGNSKFYTKTLPGFVQDLHEHMDFPLENNLYQQPQNLNSWMGCHRLNRCQKTFRNGDECEVNPICHASYQHDPIHGIALAQPAADCLLAVLDPNETCLVVTSDVLSLPTAYALRMSRKVSGYQNIKSLFYSGEVLPVRNLVTGTVLPDVSNLNSVGGFDWEGPMRCLMSHSLASTESNTNEIPCFNHYFLDSEPFRRFGLDMNLQIMQQAWKLDSIAAPSYNIRDELIFLDRHFASGKIHIFPPPISIITCEINAKETCRQKLISYAQVVWGFGLLDPEKTIIATHIAQAIVTTAFPRDIALLRHLIESYSASEQDSISILLIIVTSWNEECTKSSNHKIIKPLLDEATAINSHSTNFRIRIINEPLWPTKPEPDERPTALTRDDLHRATDISLCLSTYDVFSVTALEPLSCGAIIAVSAACGCARRLHELSGWQGNVLLVDYSSGLFQYLSPSSSLTPDHHHGAKHPVTADRIFKLTHHDRLRLEDTASHRAARDLAKMVPRDVIWRAEKMSAGRALAKLMEGDGGVVGLLGQIFTRS